MIMVCWWWWQSSSVHTRTVTNILPCTFLELVKLLGAVLRNINSTKHRYPRNSFSCQWCIEYSIQCYDIWTIFHDNYDMQSYLMFMFVRYIDGRDFRLKRKPCKVKKKQNPTTFIVTTTTTATTASATTMTTISTTIQQIISQVATTCSLRRLHRVARATKHEWQAHRCQAHPNVWCSGTWCMETM